MVKDNESGEPKRGALPRLFHAGPVWVSVVGLFVLALAWALWYGRPLLLPMVTALLLSFALRRPYSLLRRLRLPNMMAAMVVVVGGSSLVGAGLFLLAGPAAEWFEVLPRQGVEIERRITEVMKPVEKMSEQVKKVADQVETVRAKIDDLGAEAGDVDSVAVEVVDVSEREAKGMLSMVGDIGWYLATVPVLTFFLLGYGNQLAVKLAHVSGYDGGVGELASQVSTYLGTVSLINLGLGLCIGVAMALLGVPNALLWGVMAALFNFVPYLGALAGMLIMVGVSLVTFDNTTQVVLVPLVYWGLTTVEGSFVTPLILGSRFRINPVVIFVWLTTWAWVWGVPGALLAVPMLMVFHLVCQHFPSLAKLGWVMEHVPGDPVEKKDESGAEVAEEVDDGEPVVVEKLAVE